MCVAFELACKCGSGLAGFNFKDEIMTGDVISRLYCPRCSNDIKFDSEVMVADNGWIIEYDMDIARFQGRKIKKAVVITPDFIFDEGYCTWRGIYPLDHIDSTIERTEILKLAKVDPKKYLDEMKQWANKRIDRLAKEGWRKALDRENAPAQ